MIITLLCDILTRLTIFSWFSFLACAAFTPEDCFYLCMLCASSIHPLKFYVFDQLQGWRCFCKSQDLQVSLYLCTFISSYVSHLYMWRFTLSAKGHQKSSSFWIFDQILLKEFLRQNVGHVVSRWIYRVARQCTMCHMPPIREGQLVVQHTWASILGFLPPSPELSCPIYVYTQQSLKNMPRW